MSWDASRYQHHAHFVSDLGAPLLALLSPQKDEFILDLGCGEGQLMQQIAATGARVLGVDSSAEMIAAAVATGLHAENFHAEVRDGECLNYDGCFDAVFSNAALHWMKSPDAVLRGVFRALKPGGRFCAEFGAYGNIQMVVDAVRVALTQRQLDYADYDPWYFPKSEAYQQKLIDAHFVVEQMTTFQRPTALPTDVRGWLEVFAFPFLTAVADRDVFMDEVVCTLQNRLEKVDDRWMLDYVRCRFLAIKPVL